MNYYQERRAIKFTQITNNKLKVVKKENSSSILSKLYNIV